jgi:hypothetical protein
MVGDDVLHVESGVIGAEVDTHVSECIGKVPGECHKGGNPMQWSGSRPRYRTTPEETPGPRR